MVYQTIQGTQLKVSELCLGTGNLGGGISQDESFSILDTYLEQGGNFIDTAKVYSDWLPGERSASEKTIGRWLSMNRKRDQIVLATKGGHPELNTMHISRLSPPEIIMDIEASLRNLNVDHIDIYWLHRDDPHRPVGEIIETLHAQVKAGKIRYFAVSNWGIDRIQTGLAYSLQRQIPGLIASQMLWNLAIMDYSAIDPTLAWMNKVTWEYHQRTNLLAIPYSSQANGLFQKIDSGVVTNDGKSNKPMYPFNANYQRYLRIKQVAAECGYSITQVVLAYLLSQPFPVIPIIGPNSVTQLLDSLTASGCCLSQQQEQYLTA